MGELWGAMELSETQGSEIKDRQGRQRNEEVKTWAEGQTHSGTGRQTGGWKAKARGGDKVP